MCNRSRSILLIAVCEFNVVRAHPFRCWPLCDNGLRTAIPAKRTIKRKSNETAREQPLRSAQLGPLPRDWPVSHCRQVMSVCSRGHFAYTSRTPPRTLVADAAYHSMFVACRSVIVTRYVHNITLFGGRRMDHKLHYAKSLTTQRLLHHTHHTPHIHTTS